jgi:hypothetical protein
MKIKGFIITAIISGLSGALTALPVIIIFKASLIVYLPLSAGVGAFSGILARFAFNIFIDKIGRQPVLSFLAVAVVIAFGTIAGSLILGMNQAGYIAFMAAVGEALGMTIAVLTYRYYNRLNNKLQELKDKFNR